MCEYILEHGTSVNNLFQRFDDLQRLQEVKQRFSTGDLHDPGSVVLVACLMKNFFLELPEPLIPPSSRVTALQIVVEHLNLCM